MPSKIVVDKQKSCRALVNFGKANAESISTSVVSISAKDEMTVSAQKASAETLKTLLLSAGNRLQNLCNIMIKADENYIRELGDDDEPRLKRDNTAVILYDLIVEFRSVLSGAFSAETLTSLGFSEATPQDPERLGRLSQEILKSIAEKQKNGELPKPRKGISVDLSAYLPDIETNSQTLDASLDKVALERRELQVALDQKNTSLDAYDLAFKETANLFEGLFRFAGKNDLADKIRPSNRTAGQLEDPDALEKTA
jgi:hypothetical protein